MTRPAVADYPAGARLTARVIDDWEFVWMLRGRASYLGDDHLSLTPGRLLLIPPGVRHGFQWDPDRASRHGYVHFDLGVRPPAERALVRRMTRQDPLGGLCAYLLWLGRAEQPGWEARVDETLRFMADLVSSHALPDDTATAPLPTPLSAAIEQLCGAWSSTPLRRVTVGELAAAAQVSRGYLNRLFHASFSSSVADGLERLRCSRAEGLLLRTDLPLASVARESGYADPYHFSHRFRHRYGMPPGRYRTDGEPAPSVLDDDGLRRLARLVWD